MQYERELAMEDKKIMEDQLKMVQEE